MFMLMVCPWVSWSGDVTHRCWVIRILASSLLRSKSLTVALICYVCSQRISCDWDVTGFSVVNAAVDMKHFDEAPATTLEPYELFFSNFAPYVSVADAPPLDMISLISELSRSMRGPAINYIFLSKLS